MRLSRKQALRQLGQADLALGVALAEVCQLRARVAELEALLLTDREVFTDPAKVKEANAILARVLGDPS